jgi:hypothetical protein
MVASSGPGSRGLREGREGHRVPLLLHWAGRERRVRVWLLVRVVVLLRHPMMVVKRLRLEVMKRRRGRVLVHRRMERRRVAERRTGVVLLLVRPRGRRHERGGWHAALVDR